MSILCSVQYTLQQVEMVDQINFFHIRECKLRVVVSFNWLMKPSELVWVGRFTKQVLWLDMMN